MKDFVTFTKMPKNVGDLSKLIVAKVFKKFPKVRLIAQYGHTGYEIGKVQERMPIYLHGWH